MTNQDELVRICVRESQGHLETIESGLLEIQEDSRRIDPDVLNSIVRSVRSIKGGSCFYHFRNIGELTRQMEILLSQLVYGTIQSSPGMITALLTGAGALRDMLDNIDKSETYDIQQVVTLLNQFNAQAGKSVQMVEIREKTRQGAQANRFDIPEEKLAQFVKIGLSLYTLTFFLRQDLTRKGKTPFDVINVINDRGEFIESSLDINTIQGLSDCLENDLSFVVLFATQMAAERIAGTMDISEEGVVPIDMTAALQNYGEQKGSNTLYLTPRTDLVASEIDRLRDRFMKQLQENPTVSRVVFKADRIDTIDSLGVNLIIGIYRQVSSESKTFEITGAGETFLKVADFFRFPALFSVNREE